MADREGLLDDAWHALFAWEALARAKKLGQPKSLPPIDFDAVERECMAEGGRIQTALAQTLESV